jgi:siderophore synthetase component
VALNLTLSSHTVPNPEAAAEAEAARHGAQTLLNCYCREAGAPDGRVSLAAVSGQNDWPLGLRAAMPGGQALHVDLPRTGSRLIVAIEAPVGSDRYRHRSAVYARSPGLAWTPVAWPALAALLLRELSARFETPFNDELLAQICDSVETVQAILAGRVWPAPTQDGLSSYIESEQALVVGHAFHPAPKSRQGFTAADRRAYSPELRVRFPLHYFAVPREHLRQASLLDRTPVDIVREQSGLALPEDYALAPVHPWQAGHIRTLPAVRRALESGRLRDLGPQGEAYVPTSSIRTMFHPGNPYFYKLSLHVRVTNCLRKNAVYELDGALAVNGILRAVLPELTTTFPGFAVLSEPGFLTVDFADADPAERTDVNEAFGLILRDGVQPHLAEGITPVLAAALFSDWEMGAPRASDWCRMIARRERMPPAAAAQAWFSAYVERLVPPVLHALLVRGVVFEPHLQNTLIGLRDGWPDRVILRDFEGVKLIEGRFDRARVAHLEPRGQAALWYDEARGWQRIAYCLFVNQLGEAVDHLAGGDSNLYGRLWGIVRRQLQGCRVGLDTRAARQLDELIGGAPLPAKANLTTRFLKQADRLAGYAPLPSPFRSVAV